MNHSNPPEAPGRRDINDGCVVRRRRHRSPFHRAMARTRDRVRGWRDLPRNALILGATALISLASGWMQAGWRDAEANRAAAASSFPPARASAASPASGSPVVIVVDGSNLSRGWRP